MQCNLRHRWRLKTSPTLTSRILTQAMLVFLFICEAWHFSLWYVKLIKLQLVLWKKSSMNSKWQHWDEAIHGNVRIHQDMWEEAMILTGEGVLAMHPDWLKEALPSSQQLSVVTGLKSLPCCKQQDSSLIAFLKICKQSMQGKLIFSLKNAEMLMKTRCQKDFSSKWSYDVQ